MCVTRIPQSSVIPFIAAAICCFCCQRTTLLAQSSDTTNASRPNVVVFIADDMSQLDCTPYADQGFATPAIQKLAQRGMVFDRAYVASPSCAPSRAALLTAMMPQRNGAQANHTKPRADIKKWPAYFQDLGYEVVAFGKVSHYQHTQDYGFDHFAHDKFHDHAGITAAVDYLKERAKKTDPKPLCLMVGSNWPHVPWPQIPEKYKGKTWPLPAGSLDTPATQRWRSRYVSAIENADANLVTIMEAVETYLPANTIFLFTADHGAQWPFGKWNLYEAGIRVPLIVSWPDHIAPGSRTTAMVSWIDLLPTLHDIAGGNPDAQWDGKSMRGVLEGHDQEHRKHIFATHSNDNRMNVYPMRSVSDGRWKYILNLHPEFAFTTHLDLVGGADGQRKFFSTWENLAATDTVAANLLKRYHERPLEELYDLLADPHEQHNLADEPEHQAHLNRLRSVLQNWRDENHDSVELKVEPRLISDKSSYGAAAEITPAPKQPFRKP